VFKTSRSSGACRTRPNSGPCPQLNENLDPGRQRSVARFDLLSDYSRDAYLLFVPFRLRGGRVYLLPSADRRSLSSVSGCAAYQPTHKSVRYAEVFRKHRGLKRCHKYGDITCTTVSFFTDMHIIWAWKWVRGFPICQYIVARVGILDFSYLIYISYKWDRKLSGSGQWRHKSEVKWDNRCKLACVQRS